MRPATVRAIVSNLPPSQVLALVEPGRLEQLLGELPDVVFARLFEPMETLGPVIDASFPADADGVALDDAAIGPAPLSEVESDEDDEDPRIALRDTWNALLDSKPQRPEAIAKYLGCDLKSAESLLLQLTGMKCAVTTGAGRNRAYARGRSLEDYDAAQAADSLGQMIVIVVRDGAKTLTEITRAVNEDGRHTATVSSSEVLARVDELVVAGELEEGAGEYRIPKDEDEGEDEPERRAVVRLLAQAGMHLSLAQIAKGTGLKLDKVAAFMTRGVAVGVYAQGAAGFKLTPAGRNLALLAEDPEPTPLSPIGVAHVLEALKHGEQTQPQIASRLQVAVDLVHPHLVTLLERAEITKSGRGRGVKFKLATPAPAGKQITVPGT